ncbi:hypothetical protein BJX76DRAFT_368315 [Aspergillus varians]
MIRPRRNWTAEEDGILKREVRRVQAESDNISWHEIASFLPGRTNKDCRKRWYGTAAAKVKKGPWTEAEDERLRRAIEHHGTKWSVVASVVATRLPDQCSKRWSHAINPDIDHSPWTSDEHGHYWQQIVSLYFPGRTSLAAKNRYHILQRRLKSEGAGITDGICDLDSLGPMETSPWQEILWPDRSQQSCLESLTTKGSSDQDRPSSATSISSKTTLSTTSDTNPFGFEHGDSAWLPLSSDSPFYHNPAELDVQPTGNPFSRSGK